jgi:hypothetical protein
MLLGFMLAGTMFSDKMHQENATKCEFSGMPSCRIGRKARQGRKAVPAAIA